MLIGFGACQPSTTGANSSNRISEKEQAVMAIHDEVMPRMGEVVLLAETMDSLALVSRSADSLAYRNAAELLHKADKEMMHWMRAYHLPEEGTDSFKLEYLEHQHALVDTLRTHILQAIDLGKSLRK